MTDEQFADLFKGLERYFTKRLDEMDAKIDRTNAKIDKFHADLDAKIEKVETTLLTEFHKWASPIDAKVRTHRSWFSEVDAELDLLKLRVKKLEGGTSSDPAQH